MLPLKNVVAINTYEKMLRLTQYGLVSVFWFDRHLYGTVKMCFKCRLIVIDFVTYVGSPASVLVVESKSDSCI